MSGGKSVEDADTADAAVAPTEDDGAHRRDAGGEPRLAPATRLGGRYRIGRLLGAGGMGAVYQALDEILGKDVALKVLHGARPDELARLRDEVLQAQKVTHRNVCRTWDLEEVDGYYLLKMELVDGEPLSAELAREGRLGIARARAVARAVAEGLEAAHREGVVHRDLKPHNLLVEKDTGRVVLVDFGIAHSAAARADGTVAGTPAYMAPEQVRGDAVDGRSDLYALGCVLFEMLAGRVPLPASSTKELLRRQLEDAAPDVRTLRPDAPPDLATLCARLLEKDPARRPTDAREVLRALEGPQRGRWWRLPAVAAALVAAALAALSLRPAWRPVIKSLPRVYDENANEAVFSPDGRWIAYASDRNDRGADLWQTFVESLDGKEVRAIGPRAIPFGMSWGRDGRSVMFRDWEAHAVVRVPVDGGPVETLEAPALAAAPCGDAILLLLERAGHDLLVRRTAEHHDATLVEGDAGDELWNPRCDRDGRRVTWWARHTHGTSFDLPADLYVAATDGSGGRAVLADGAANVQPTFAADGRSLVFSRLEGEHRNLFELSLDGGKPRQLTFDDGADFSPDVSPDGKLLLYSIDSTSFLPFAFAPDGGRRRLSAHAEDVTQLAPTPDDSEVVAQVVRRGESLLVAYPARGGGDERLLGQGEEPTVTADGREVVFTRRSPSGSHEIAAIPIGGGAARVLCALDDPPRHLVAGHDGFVYFVRHGGQAWRAALAGGAPERAAPDRWIKLWSAADGWRVAVEQLATGTLLAHLVCPGAALDDASAPVIDAAKLRLSSDGRQILYQSGRTLRRRVLATGVDAFALDHIVTADVAIGSDGKTVYGIEPTGGVRRVLVTNFADRPRP